MDLSHEVIVFTLCSRLYHSSLSRGQSRFEQPAKQASNYSVMFRSSATVDDEEAYYVLATGPQHGPYELAHPPANGRLRAPTAVVGELRE
jgi:hypothetical protein